MSTNLGIGTTQALPHAGCGAAAATAQPSPGALHAAAAGPLGGFAIPAFAGMATAMAAMPVERFASSMSGGVILGKDGAPAGRIPAGSFVDTRDGTIFNPDGTKLTLPEGSTADFFDLPDIKELIDANRAATAANERMAALANAAGGGLAKGSGPGSAADSKDHHAMMQSFVDGQWGPGGVTPIKGGGAAAGACDMDHGTKAAPTEVAGASGGPATKAGGSTTAAATATAANTATATNTTTAVAGASGNPTIDSLNATIASLMEQVRRITPSATSGGGATLAATNGVAQLGSVDLLRLAVRDLVGAIGQLDAAIRDINQVPPTKPPTIAEPAPTKVTPPAIEPPKTEAPKTESTSSGSGSGGDTTAAASDSSSS